MEIPWCYSVSANASHILLFYCNMVYRAYWEATPPCFPGGSTVLQWEFFLSFRKPCLNSGLPLLHCRDIFRHPVSSVSITSCHYHRWPFRRPQHPNRLAGPPKACLNASACVGFLSGELTHTPLLSASNSAFCLVDSIPFWFAALIFQFWYTKIRVPVQIPCIFIRLRIFSLLCERPMAASNDPNRLARPQRSAPDATKSICTNYIFSHISMGKLNWSSYDNWAGNIKLWVQRQE